MYSFLFFICHFLLRSQYVNSPRLYDCILSKATVFHLIHLIIFFCIVAFIRIKCNYFYIFIWFARFLSLFFFISVFSRINYTMFCILLHYIAFHTELLYDWDISFREPEWGNKSWKTLTVISKDITLNRITFFLSIVMEEILLFVWIPEKKFHPRSVCMR